MSENIKEIRCEEPTGHYTITSTINISTYAGQEGKMVQLTIGKWPFKVCFLNEEQTTNLIEGLKQCY
jgi:hypothetical protein